MDIVVTDLQVRVSLDEVRLADGTIKVLLGDHELSSSIPLKGREHLFLASGTSFLAGYLEVGNHNPLVLEGIASYMGSLNFLEELLIKGVLDISYSSLAQVIIEDYRISFPLFWHILCRFPKGEDEAVISALRQAVKALKPLDLV